MSNIRKIKMKVEVMTFNNNIISIKQIHEFLKKGNANTRTG